MSHLAYSRSFPVAVDTAYDVVLPVPLEEVLGRRHLAFPGIAAVEQDRPWGEELGQRRALRFSDGGAATEVLTVLERPRRFGYELAELSGPMRLLATTVHGRWDFEPDGSATRVTWSWEIRPTLPGRLAMPAIAVMWRGMAARCFDALGERLAA
jgi:hypothetical protein